MSPGGILARFLRRSEAVATPVVEEAPESEPPHTASRLPVELRGVVSAVALRPRGGTPWLEVEFTDDTGALTLTWMGRRQIPGVEVGRKLVVHGRVSVIGGKRRLFNPRYELLP